MELVKQPKYVTALYDINRSASDGRTVATYLDWLKSTLNAFPNTIVFHDGSINSDFEIGFPTTTFIQFEFSKLQIYEFRDQLFHLCDYYQRSGSRDLVYTNIDYGILINSKLEFLNLAFSYDEDFEYIWIDAGIARFKLEKFEFPRITSRNLIRPYLLFDIRNYLRRSLHSKSFKMQKVASYGSSERVIGAVSIFIPNNMISSYCLDYYEFLKMKVAQGKWDTEQVFLLEFSVRKAFFYIIETRGDHLQFWFKLNSRFGFFSKALSSLLKKLLA